MTTLSTKVVLKLVLITRRLSNRFVFCSRIINWVKNKEFTSCSTMRHGTERRFVSSKPKLFQDIRDKMTLVFWSLYSPDLNPIELLWRVTRREVTHNAHFPDDVTLAHKLDLYFSDFRKPNPKNASLCSIKNSY